MGEEYSKSLILLDHWMSFSCTFMFNTFPPSTIQLTKYLI